VITGARQTGKTTLVKNTYGDLKYINLDAPENRDIIRETSTFQWHTVIGNSVIDEAQKEPIVFEKTKYSYDEDKISFSVLLGSSQILLLKKIRETLAGRVTLFELWPLMLSEYCNNNSSTLKKMPLIESFFADKSCDRILAGLPSRLMPEEASTLKSAEEYMLNWGGMPALLEYTDEEKLQWLKDYQYTYLERDITDLARLDDLSPFRKFEKLASLRSGSLLNYSELARDAGLSVDSARRYMEYLKVSYQVILLQPYYKNLTSSTVKTPKLYWSDIGLLRQLTRNRNILSGEVYETYAVSELHKWIKTCRKDAELYFYRTRSGLELDLLMKTGYGIFGFEIKSRDKVYEKDCNSMKRIAAALGNEWMGGAVIYRGSAIKKIADPEIWAVPAFRLFT